MNSLHFWVTTIILLFLASSIYAIFYFRQEFKIISNHKLYKLAKSAVIIPLIILIVLGFAALTITLFADYLNFKTQNGYLQFTTLGEVGDLFNGMIAPIIALLSVILFYKAYREQIRTNAKNDEIKLLEYCHNRLAELTDDKTIKTFEDNCDIYNNHAVQQERRERSLRRILSTLEEFENIRKIVSDMELHSDYLENRYLTVLHDYYYPGLLGVNQTIVARAVFGGQMIYYLLSFENKYNEIFRSYNSKLSDEGFI